MLAVGGSLGGIGGNSQTGGMVSASGILAAGGALSTGGTMNSPGSGNSSAVTSATNDNQTSSDTGSCSCQRGWRALELDVSSHALRLWLVASVTQAYVCGRRSMSVSMRPMRLTACGAAPSSSDSSLYRDPLYALDAERQRGRVLPT
jgi:hypothetical protein